MGSENCKNAQNENQLLETNRIVNNQNFALTRNINFRCSQIPKEKPLLFLEQRKIEQKKNSRFPTLFEWDNKGISVYLTGSFCDWQQFFLMEKHNEGKFFLTLFLPKGIYQYKFKVDDEWKINDKFPKCQDINGNINNYMDTRRDEIFLRKIENGKFRPRSGVGGVGTDFSTEGCSKGGTIYTNFSLCDSYISEEEYYNNIVPIKDGLDTMPPVIPTQYGKAFDIDFNIFQKSLSIKKFYKNKENNILCDNYSYKKIEPLFHENIGHFHIKDKCYSKKKNNFIIICFSSNKFRDKLSTFVYYKPIKN